MKTRVNDLLQRTTNQQKAAFGICVVIVGAGLMWFMGSGEPSNRTLHKGDSETTRIVADLTRGARAERSWLDISEDRFTHMEARLKRLERERQKLEKDNELLAQQNADMAIDANQAIDAQAQEIERLRQQVATISQAMKTQASAEQEGGQTPSQVTIQPDLSNLPPAITENPFERARGEHALVSGTRGALAPQIRSRTDLYAGGANKPGEAAPNTANLIHFNLVDREGGSKDLTRYIPAGAYAPAVTAALGGVRQTTDIEGCTVTGAAFGDLSSEKIYVRLQTMTCSRRPGQVFETDVQGYMAGRGKAGVRGIVVSREGALVAQSFIAGAVGGIGSAAAEALQPSIINTGATGVGITTGQQQITDILKGGIGQGLDNAGSKISDYLVKRAEQYQPVVVMQAGTSVELVFITGVNLNPDGQITTIQREIK